MTTTQWRRYVALSIVLILWTVGCSSTPTKEDSSAPAPDQHVMGQASGPLPVDGSHDGYPALPVELGGMVVYMAHDGERLYVHATAEVDGWIAVGFNKRGAGMDGANLILGFSGTSSPVARNDVGLRHSHREVRTSGILEWIVTQTEDSIVLEFSYPMAFPPDAGFALSGLQAGEVYALIVATHARSGDFSHTHTSRNQTDFAVGSARQ